MLMHTLLEVGAHACLSFEGVNKICSKDEVFMAFFMGQYPTEEFIVTAYQSLRSFKFS